MREVHGSVRAKAIAAALVVLGAAACESPLPPAPCGSVPPVTVQAKEAAVFNACFNDPNGDQLSLSATSSNPGVATVSLAGTVLTIRANAPGSATVTVTATDAGGLQGRQSFEVVVPNRAPRPRGAMPAMLVAVGEPETVDASIFFADPDGDTLVYGAESSSPAVATVSVSGGMVTVTAVARGANGVTVTATDPGGLMATQTFRVTVPNQPPEPVGTIPADSVGAGKTVEVDLSAYFTDPDGDALTYGARSSDTEVAAVSVAGAIVTVTAIAQGVATITATARDPHGLAATQQALVTVTRANRAPRPVGTIPARRLVTGDEAAIDVAGYFEDPDGDALGFAARSSDTGVAEVSVSGPVVTVTAVATGSATITVTATDPGGLAAESPFGVGVNGADPGLFRIELVLATEMTLSQEEAFRDAARRWMSILAATDLPDLELNRELDCSGDYEQSVGTIDDLMIVAAVVDIDGTGGTLGRAGPCWVRSAGYMPFFGMMEFDAADLDRLEEDGLLTPVILHEMAHVLGFGTLWEHHGLLRDASSTFQVLDTHFEGRLAIEAFDSAGGAGYADGAKVPVENRGGSGTRNGHWRASVFGSELMIGYIGSSLPSLSAVSLQSLADMGYRVDAGLADAYSLPDAQALASALGGAIHLGNDVRVGPIVVADADGRVVRVIR